MNKCIFLLLLFISTSFSNTTIKLKNIQEYKITPKKVQYKIQAESKNINYKKLKKFKFYNKEKIVSNSSYYLEGNLSSKGLNINFEKGYFLEGKFIMLNLTGNYKDMSFFAKKAIYSEDSLVLKNSKIKTLNKRYRKYNYKIKL